MISFKHYFTETQYKKNLILCVKSYRTGIKIHINFKIIIIQELELAANQISDITPLCVCPPPLIHLGLSYNKISSITGHMEAASWYDMIKVKFIHLVCKNCGTVFLEMQ